MNWEISKKSNLLPLLEETPEAYYWIGFLMADGGFQMNRYLRLELSSMDKEHLLRFSNFINYSGKYIIHKNCIAISCGDHITVPQIMVKFDMKSRKTYNPPEHLPDVSDELLLSLIIGFIDGDGCIQKQSVGNNYIIKIQCHGSWIFILQEMMNVINNHYGMINLDVKINNRGYSFFRIFNPKVQRGLKQIALDLTLPIMERKWDKIDEHRIDKADIDRERVENILELAKSGFSYEAIKEKLPYNHSTIRVIMWKNGFTKKGLNNE